MVFVNNEPLFSSVDRGHSYLYGVLQCHLSRQPPAKTDKHTARLPAAHHWLLQRFPSKTSGYVSETSATNSCSPSKKQWNKLNE